MFKLRLALCIFTTCLAGSPFVASAAEVLLPNGDFSTPAGVSWAQVSGGGSYTYSYPAAGGNPGGYGVIDNSAGGGGFGIWIANGDVPMTLASLGLVAGNTYTFKQDMITLIGGAGNRAGVKIESWSNTGVLSDSGDINAATESSAWATYSFNYTINPAATRIKVVPLWGQNRSMGYDNFRVQNVPVVPSPVVPNGDFEIANGASWTFIQGGGQTVTYPATGGNPNGCAIIDSVGKGSFAILIANNNAFMSLASLGLTAGQTYTFKQDMKILQGTSIGGLKVDFNAGSTGDTYPTVIGDGSQWATYSFSIAIPAGVTSLKIVPLWGPNAKVAYDNFKIVPPAPPQPFSATIVPVQAISWTPTSALNSYQPQSSTDGSTWINVGPAFTGTAVTSIFVDVPLPYYQVVEGIPSTVESIQNGGFEFVDGSGAPTSWGVVQSQPPTVITTDFHTGAASIRVAVANAASEPNGSEIQQNIVNAGSAPITVGSSYALSFWAKQISSGVSYVQQYKVTWLDGSGNITGNGGLQNFVGGNNAWTQFTQTGLTAPANTTSALIQIFGVTGAVSGGLGEVHVDDVSLTSIGFQPVAFLATVMQPGAKIGWPSATGRSYQVKASNDLSAWANVGAAITGDGSRKFYNEAIVQPKKFYRIHETQ